MASFIKWWLFLPQHWRVTASHTCQLSHILQLHWVPMTTRILGWLLRPVPRGAAKELVWDHVLLLASQILPQCIWLHLISSLPRECTQAHTAPGVMGACLCGISLCVAGTHSLTHLAFRGHIRSPSWRGQAAGTLHQAPG